MADHVLELSGGTKVLNPVPSDPRTYTTSLSLIAQDPTYKIGVPTSIYDEETNDYYVITGGDSSTAWVFTARGTGGGAVDSVNGETGVVVLTQDDIGGGTTNVQYPTTDRDKLAGIEAGAEVNQTDAEIKTQYELNANTNAFTDAEQTKLTGIEAGAEVNQTDAEIKIQYENNANTNAFTDAEQTKLTGIEVGAEVNQTDAEIKTQYEANTNTNAFTDAEQTKLGGVEAGAEVNQTDAEIKTQYEANADTNAFTDAEQTKLGGIEAGAEVNNLTDIQASSLTSGTNSTDHFHTVDRDRANHTGTQTASTISDFASTLAGTTNTTPFTPTADNHVATKKYVDDSAGGVTLPTFEAVAYDNVSYTVDMTSNNTVKLSIPDGTTALTLLFSGASSAEEQVKKLILDNTLNNSNVAVITLTGNWTSMLGSPVELTDIAANGKITTTLNSDNVADSVIYSFAQNY